jgi:hypothetical protein
MIRHDMDDISDEVFDDIVNPCNEYIINYIKENFLNEFIAFDIATCYNMNAMWDEPFETQINSAIEDLSQLRVSDCDKSKVISILESKYKLRVKNESPIDIEDIKD